MEVLLHLKGKSDAVDFKVVDITKPRDPELLVKSRGTTALPLIELEDGRVLKESLVILRYIDERFADQPIARSDPYERGVERFFIAREGKFVDTGYMMVMNRDRAKTETFKETMLSHYRWLNEQLEHFNPGGLWLFDDFGLAEAVYAPMMMRFWFLEYYEDFTLPDTAEFERVARWRQACMTHPATQQVCYDEIVTLYYDYAVGFGNGALPTGRDRSSFVFDPDWRERPLPPKDKYDRIASDAELGLI